MLTEICLKLDDSILLSLREEKEKFIQNLRFSYALTRYRQNKLSLGKAAELAGLDRLDFMQRLKTEGEPIFDYDVDTLTDMIAGAQRTFALLQKESSL